MEKITKNFYITEFVSYKVFKQFGEKSHWFVDRRIVELAQFTRDYFWKSMTINNWWDANESEQDALPSERQYSGFREPSCTIGGTLSQHRFGRAIDIRIVGLTPQEVYTAILAAKEKFMAAGLTTLEDIRDTPTWNHLDIRYTGKSDILIVRP